MKTIELDSLQTSALIFALKKATHTLRYDIKNKTGIAERIQIELLMYDLNLWERLQEELIGCNQITITAERIDKDGY